MSPYSDAAKHDSIPDCNLLSKFRTKWRLWEWVILFWWNSGFNNFLYPLITFIYRQITNKFETDKFKFVNDVILQ